MEVSSGSPSSSQKSQPIANTKHNKSTFILLIVLLILLVATLAIVAVLLAQSVKVQNRLVREDIKIDPGVWRLFDLDAICGTDIAPSCVAPNGNTPYGRCLYPSLGDNPVNYATGSDIQKTTVLVGAHSLEYGDAYLVVGEIPRNRIYWAWTGYLWEYSRFS